MKLGYFLMLFTSERIRTHLETLVNNSRYSIPQTATLCS